MIFVCYIQEKRVLLLPTGMAVEEALQLILTALPENPEELTLKSITSTNEKQRNDVIAQVKICDVCTVNSKINLLRITVLNLSHCNLKGILKEFSALENLKVLNLSHNKLEVPPECLEVGLKFVEHLDLSHNLLAQFETEPLCHKRLKHLLLTNNKLLNVPEWILYIRCFNLEEFDYSCNEINGLYASQFHVSSSYKLKKLVLQSCYLFERDFKYLNAVRTLQYFDASNHSSKFNSNIIKGELLFQKPHFCETLEVLKLNYLNLSILSQDVNCLVNLRQLYLKSNNLTWLPDSITSLKRLEILDISDNLISYLPASLHEMCNLWQLILYNNCLSNFPALQMPQLRYLDLYNNSLSNFDFDSSALTHLDLEQNCFNTDAFAHQYVQKRQKLRAAANFTGRLESPRILVEVESGDDHSSSLSEDVGDNEELERVFEEPEQELWDVPFVSGYVRECTSSDDEWVGSEPLRVAMVKRNSAERLEPKEFPVFFDAQE